MKYTRMCLLWRRLSSIIPTPSLCLHLVVGLRSYSTSPPCPHSCVSTHVPPSPLWPSPLIFYRMTTLTPRSRKLMKMIRKQSGKNKTIFLNLKEEKFLIGQRDLLHLWNFLLQNTPLRPHPSCCGHCHQVERKSPTKASVLSFAQLNVEKGLKICPLCPLPPQGGGGRERRTPPGPRPSLHPGSENFKALACFLKSNFKGEFVCIFYLHFIFLYILWRGQPFLSRSPIDQKGALKCVFSLFLKVNNNKKKFLNFTCGVTMSKPFLSQRRRGDLVKKKKIKNAKKVQSLFWAFQ